MARSGPTGQLGIRTAARRQTPDDQSAQPVTQPSPHWPPPYGEQPGQRAPQQQGYSQAPTQPAGQHWPPPYNDAPTQRGQQAQPAGQGYYFPQGAEGEAAQGYAPQPAAHQATVHPLPFNRFPAPEANGNRGFAPPAAGHQLPFNSFPQPRPEPDPNYGYAQQGSEQQAPFSFPHTAQQQPGAGAPGWGQQAGQQADPRGFDLGNYMSTPGQGYAQPEGDHFQAHEPPPFAAPQGYGETDAEFDEGMAEEEEEPRRGRRGLMIVAALVGAIGLGGGMAYGYKTFFPSRTGPAPLIKDTQGPIKSRPEVADGKGFAHTDKKLLNRLGDDAAPQGANPSQPNPADAPDDRASDDPNAPRKVRTFPITPGGGPQPMQTAAVPAAPVMALPPGVTLDNMGPPPRMQLPPQGPPSAARVQLPPPSNAPPVRAVQAQPPVRVASAANMPPPAAAEPAAPAKKAPVAAPSKQAVPKTKEASAGPAVTASSGAGFVAVLASRTSRMDALTAFANMQEKFGEVLANRTPDVQEANLGEKGIRYRLVVGPPGSRESATSLCAKLKAAGHADCWVTSY